MVCKPSRRTDHSSDTETKSTTNRVAQQTTDESKSPSGSWSRQSTLEESQAHFGMDVPDKDTMFRLQRLEAMNTSERVRGWVDEGMTVDDMGNPLMIEAFRERQAERPPEVPKTIERQNRRSVLRSEKAAGDTSPAGDVGIPESVRDVISSTGQSLDPAVQRAMENRMDDSFSDVQIHTGAQAAAACESINARAFTVGNHIAFNAGEYDPSSPESQHVLAHELAHVRQQTGGAVSMLPQEDVELEIDPDPQLEREAEETAQQVMEGGELGIQRLAGTAVHIQRRVDDGSRGKVTDTAALKSDLKIATASVKAAGKEFTKRFVPNEFIAGYEAGKAEAENQANEGLTLNNLGVSAEWAEILEDSPAKWKQQITQQAVKAAKAATGSGNSQADELGR